MPSTQDLDVYRSDDFEEINEHEGYHVSPLGALAISFSFMAIIPLILYENKTILMELIWIIFIVGFAAYKHAEVPTVFEFDTLTDALWWSIPLGAIITIAEVWVANVSASVINSPIASAVQISLLAVTVGAVGEEMLRVGIYLPSKQFLASAGLPENAAIVVAQVLQATIFSLQHMYVYNTPDIFIALFIGGLMYGAAFEYKKDLTIPILAHLTVNYSGFKDEAVAFAASNPVFLIAIILLTGIFILIKLRA